MLDLADLQVQPEDNLMAAISRAWYNGSYTMTAEPIKCLELHYTMIQILITSVIWSFYSRFFVSFFFFCKINCFEETKAKGTLNLK